MNIKEKLKNINDQYLIGHTGRECVICNNFKSSEEFSYSDPSVCQECMGKYSRKNFEEIIENKKLKKEIKKVYYYKISRIEIVKFRDSFLYENIKALLIGYPGNTSSELINVINEKHIINFFSNKNNLRIRDFNRLLYLFELLDSQLIKVEEKDRNFYYYGEIKENYKKKKCRICGEEKLIREFYRCRIPKKNGNTFNSACISCLRKKRKK
jgi:hypothetical protein